MNTIKIKGYVFLIEDIIRDVEPVNIDSFFHDHLNIKFGTINVCGYNKAAPNVFRIVDPENYKKEKEKVIFEMCKQGKLIKIVCPFRCNNGKHELYLVDEIFHLCEIHKDIK